MVNAPIRGWVWKQGEYPGMCQSDRPSPYYLRAARFSALTIIAVLILFGLATSPAQARSLLDELHTLLATHPALKASMSEANARREEIGAAQSTLFPYVQTTGETGLERTDAPTNEQLRTQLGVTVTQNLYDGLGTHNRIRVSEINERVGHSDLETVQNSLLLDGVQSYIDVVLQNKLIEISSRHVDIVQEITDFIATEREAGRMTLADSLQSRARLQQAKETLISFDGGRRNSEAHYQTLFGQVPDVRAMDDPVAPTAIIPVSLNEALNYALDNNPMLEAARLGIDMAEANRQASGATAMPKVDLEGSLDFKNDYDGATGSEEEGTLLVKFTWDLFDGYRTSATEMAAAHRTTAAMATLHQRELEITEQVRRAWNSMIVDRERMHTLTEAQSIALEAYDARYSLMVTGKETIINVLDTALEVLNVRLSLTTADYRYRLSVYRLLHAMGRLNPGTVNAIITVIPMDLDSISDIAPNRLNPEDLIQAPAQDNGAGQTMASNTAPASAADTPITEQMVLALPSVEAAAPTPLATQPASAATTAMVMESGTGYLVVLSSNRQRGNAVSTLEKLNLQGAEIMAVDVKGSPMYMVIIGPLPEPEARVVQGEAFDAGVLDAWLKKL